MELVKLSMIKFLYSLIVIGFVLLQCPFLGRAEFSYRDDNPPGHFSGSLTFKKTKHFLIENSHTITYTIDYGKIRRELNYSPIC